jgi:hypothetical protein
MESENIIIALLVIIILLIVYGIYIYDNKPNIQNKNEKNTICRIENGNEICDININKNNNNNKINKNYENKKKKVRFDDLGSLEDVENIEDMIRQNKEEVVSMNKIDEEENE